MKNVECFFAIASAIVACLCSHAAEARPDMIAKAKSGKLPEARASWWGFDAKDSTEFLQAAIDSGVPTLVIDKMPSPWIVRPLKGKSGQKLVFEKGCELLAKEGEFLAKGDCLLTFRRCHDVEIEGTGARFRMRHDDYHRPPYEKSEWRHALSFISCSNVVVRGLTLADSGGDGIYLGACEPVRKNVDVVIDKVICTGNNRQGISVISAENLLIKNSVFRDTHGTSPSAGIDFEPNRASEVLKNCVVFNCTASGNAGTGFTTWAGNFDTTTEPMSISFIGCKSIGDARSFFFAVSSGGSRDVSGKLVVKGCSFENPTGTPPVRILGNRFDTLSFNIADNKLVQTNSAGESTVTSIGKEWAAANIPMSEGEPYKAPPQRKPDFSKAKVKDTAPGKPVELEPMKVRHFARYAVYAAKAGEMKFTGRQCHVGRYEPSAKPIVVKSIDGDKVGEIPIPGYDSTALTFTAPKPGFYQLEFDLGPGAFLMETSDAPLAIDVGDSGQGLIASEGSLWFYVPAGRKSFAFLASGSEREMAHVVLRDPFGGRAWERDNISNWTRTVQKYPKAGLWKVTLSRPSNGSFEDAIYDLMGVPGFLFLSKEKIWALP